jgi:tetratricopeptide (TPR) repeat protein
MEEKSMKKKILIKRCERSLENGDLEKAIKLAKQSVEAYPDSFDAWYCLGKVYHNTGDNEKAIETLKKAEELASNENKKLSIYQYIGSLLINIGKLDDALIYFNKALTLAILSNKGTTYALSKIAYIYFRKGDLEKSAEYYNKAMESGMKENASENLMLEIGNNFCVVLVELGQYKEAIALLKDLLAIGTISGDLRFICQTEINLGGAYFRMGNKDVAKRYFTMGLNHAKKLGNKELEATACMHLGHILNKRSYLNRAEELFKELSQSSVPFDRRIYGEQSVI